MEEVYKLRFFYSFQIPKLGKEFDLLQIKDDQIVNIELEKRQRIGRGHPETADPEPVLSVRFRETDPVVYLYQQ